LSAETLRVLFSNVLWQDGHRDENFSCFDEDVVLLVEPSDGQPDLIVVFPLEVSDKLVFNVVLLEQLIFKMFGKILLV